jgi:hypothetical protein
VTDCSLVQRNRTECGVSECDMEASTVRGLTSFAGCPATGKEKIKRSQVFVGRRRHLG